MVESTGHTPDQKQAAQWITETGQLYRSAILALEAAKQEWHAAIATAEGVLKDEVVADYAQISSNRVRQIRALDSSPTAGHKGQIQGRPSRLTAAQTEQVRELYSRHESGKRHYTQADLATQFEVHPAVIQRCVTKTPLAPHSTPAPPPPPTDPAVGAAAAFLTTTSGQSRTDSLVETVPVSDDRVAPEADHQR